jgi:hypothetical protein
MYYRLLLEEHTTMRLLSLCSRGKPNTKLELGLNVVDTIQNIFSWVCGCISTNRSTMHKTTGKSL